MVRTNPNITLLSARTGTAGTRRAAAQPFVPGEDGLDLPAVAVGPAGKMLRHLASIPSRRRSLTTLTITRDYDLAHPQPVTMRILETGLQARSCSRKALSRGATCEAGAGRR